MPHEVSHSGRVHGSDPAALHALRSRIAALYPDRTLRQVCCRRMSEVPLHDSVQAGENRMTAQEFVSHLAPVDLERLALIFNFLADHGHVLQLESGEFLRDGLDFSAFHREVATACKFPERESQPGPELTLRRG